MIKILPTGLRSSAARFGAFICVATALLAVTAPRAAAALVTTQGSATATATSVVFNADTTISIESVQSGYLSNIGAFTAQFSYTAIPTPAAIAFVGSGTLVTARGDHLFLQALFVAVGLDYPRTLEGALIVTGGTGRFAGATGTLLISGLDEESLTDTVHIQGAIVTPGSLLGGLLK